MERGYEMEVMISSDLQRIYKESHKNYDMAVMTLLDSLDPNVFLPAFEIINSFSCTGERVAIKLGKTAVEQIKSTFEDKEVTSELISILLWIAVLFPEI